MMEPARTSPTALLSLVLCAILAALGFATGAGCGGSAAEYGAHDTVTVVPERESPAELAEEQLGLDDRLAEVLSRPEPDCGRACELGDAICDLSTRICGIAERHPDDTQTSTRCTDASARCEGARERIAAQCTCPTP